MCFIEDGRFTTSNDTQFIKHIAGIFVTPSGICNGVLSNDMQSEKQ